jgi:hypothetical protein
MRGSLLIAFLAITVQSCVDCGPQRELSIEIHFGQDSLRLDSILAVNALEVKFSKVK